MSVEKIVEQRVKKLEDNQERLIQVDKISNIGLFGDIFTGTNYEDWRKTNKIFSDGYATGLEEGLRDPFNTDKLVNTEDIKDDRQKEFYQKFLELSKKYNCRFTFHPSHGMILEDLEK
tara:strand:+ start:56 stop:409 length:354 start_codon:yes stop_codon:yes gene_type:complete